MSHTLQRNKRKVKDIAEAQSFLALRASAIGCKAKRTAIYRKQKSLKKTMKRTQREERAKVAEALGDAAPEKAKPQTQDTLRERDETMVTADDEEVKGDERIDEFAPYFSGEKTPKVLITTSYKPGKATFALVEDLLLVYSQAVFYERKGFPLKKIVEQAKEKNFTDIIVLKEDHKEVNAWTQIHLPNGPTARYRFTGLRLRKDMPKCARADLSQPEVILNNFNTRLGHRVGRMLGAGFHQKPNFRARRVVTFHNQRDFIFFRHHRYIFNRKEKDVKARLQEIGPRFTLKLQTLQAGTFDTKHGEYEWVHDPDMDTSRRRFHL